MYCDLEPAELYRVYEPKAAKQHKCCECAAPIYKGEKHVKVDMLFKGEFTTDRQHELCAQACEFVRDNLFSDGDCIPFGYLWEWWGEEGKHGNKTGENNKAIRKMLADILRRERKERP